MKVGIVGAGRISRLHLSAIARYPGAHPVGIADVDLERARAEAGRHAVPGAFSSLPALMDSARPDIVHVLTPPDTHAGLAIEAMERGAHVLVEKPMAVSVDDCRSMATTALRTGRQLCVGHCWLYTAGLLHLQHLLDSGEAGEIFQASASFTFDLRRSPDYARGHWSTQLPGGIAEDLAVHPISALIRLLGNARLVSAVTRPGPVVAEGQTQEMRALLEGDRGPGSVAVSLGSRPDAARLDVWCRSMMVRMNLSTMSLVVERDLPMPRKLARGVTNLHAAAQLMTGTLASTWRLLRGKVDGSYGVVPLVHAFYDALAAGRPAPVGPGEGLAAVAALRAIWPVPAADHPRPAPVEAGFSSEAARP